MNLETSEVMIDAIEEKIKTRIDSDSDEIHTVLVGLLLVLRIAQSTGSDRISLIKEYLQSQNAYIFRNDFIAFIILMCKLNLSDMECCLINRFLNKYFINYKSTIKDNIEKQTKKMSTVEKYILEEGLEKLLDGNIVNKNLSKNNENIEVLIDRILESELLDESISLLDIIIIGHHINNAKWALASFNISNMIGFIYDVIYDDERDKKEKVIFSKLRKYEKYLIVFFSCFFANFFIIMLFVLKVSKILQVVIALITFIVGYCGWILYKSHSNNIELKYIRKQKRERIKKSIVNKNKIPSKVKLFSNCYEFNNNDLQLKVELERAINAKLSLVLIESSEEERVRKVFNTILNEWYYSATIIDQGVEFNKIYTTEILSGYDVILVSYSKAVDLKKSFYVYLSEVSKINNITTILINDVKSDINYFAISKIIKLGMLNREDINKWIDNLKNRYAKELIFEWDKEQIDHVSKLLCGMRYKEIEQEMRILVFNNMFNSDGLEYLKTIKINEDVCEAVEIINTKGIVEIVGFDNVTNWIINSNNIYKKIILFGVPGCGKSLYPKYISNKLELPLLRMNLLKTKHKWVGESEESFMKALTFVKNQAPCVVWIDEIEKVLAGAYGSSTHHLDQRLFSELLYWLSELNDDIMIIATSNDIEILPPELKRRGRFDDIFFVDLPEDNEREKLIELYWNKTSEIELTDDEINGLVMETKGFSGADFEYVFSEITPRSKDDCDRLIEYIKNGFYDQLSREPERIKKLQKQRSAYKTARSLS